MISALTRRTEEIRKFRANPWRFQKTFETPLKDLPRFVSTFLALFQLESGVVKTDQVVFEPEHLLRLMGDRSILVSDWRFILKADSQREIAVLLEATLSDWVDFIFVPHPESFAIYADHDEFITFFTLQELTLKRLGEALEQAGFKPANWYTRPTEGNWR